MTGRIVLALAMVLGATTQPPPADAGDPGRAAEGALAGAERALTRAATRLFMDHYAELLRAGDRNALANLYHRDGAWRVGQGERAFERWEAIRHAYATRWQPPASFAWRELDFEPLGEDAVVVVGRFEWGRGEGRPPLACSYTGLLVRQDGVMRIRLEDESCAPG